MAVRRLATPTVNEVNEEAGHSFSYTPPSGTDRVVIVTVVAGYQPEEVDGLSAFGSPTLNGNAPTGTLADAVTLDTDGSTPGSFYAWYWAGSGVQSGTLSVPLSGNISVDGSTLVVQTWENVNTVSLTLGAATQTPYPAIVNLTSATVPSTSGIIQGACAGGGFFTTGPTWDAGTDTPPTTAFGNTTSGGDSLLTTTDSTGAATGAADTDLATYYASNGNWNVGVASYGNLSRHRGFHIELTEVTASDVTFISSTSVSSSLTVASPDVSRKAIATSSVSSTVTPTGPFVARDMIAPVSASATVTPALTRFKLMQASASVTSTVTGTNPSIIRNSISAIAATSTVTIAAPGVLRSLISTTTTSSSVVPSSSVNRPIVSTTTASALVSANIGVPVFFTGDPINVTSSVAALLGVSKDFASTTTASSTVSASLGVTKAFVSTTTASSTVVSSSDVDRPLISTTTASVAITPVLASARSLVSTTTASSTVSGDLFRPRTFVATVSTTSNVTTSIDVSRELTSTTSATTSVTGNIDETLKLVSVTASTSVLGPVPSLDVVKALNSTTTASSTITSSITSTLELSSLVSATAILTPAFGGSAAVASVVTASSTSTGTMDLVLGYVSTVTPTSLVTGVLGATRLLESSIATTLTVTPSLQVTKSLAATITSTSFAQASFEGDLFPTVTASVSSTSSSATSHNVTLPTHSYGQDILVFVNVTNNATVTIDTITSSDRWQVLERMDYETASNGDTYTYRIRAQSTSEVLQLDLSTAGVANWQAYAISDVDGYFIHGNTGTSIQTIVDCEKDRNALLFVHSQTTGSIDTFPPGYTFETVQGTTATGYKQVGNGDYLAAGKIATGNFTTTPVGEKLISGVLAYRHNGADAGSQSTRRFAWTTDTEGWSWNQLTGSGTGQWDAFTARYPDDAGIGALLVDPNAVTSGYWEWSGTFAELFDCDNVDTIIGYEYAQIIHAFDPTSNSGCFLGADGKGALTIVEPGSFERVLIPNQPDSITNGTQYNQKLFVSGLNFTGADTISLRLYVTAQSNNSLHQSIFIDAVVGTDFDTLASTTTSTSTVSATLSVDTVYTTQIDATSTVSSFMDNGTPYVVAVAQSGASSFVSNFTPTLPTHEAGDLIVVLGSMGDNGFINTNDYLDGWRINSSITLGSSDATVYVAWKIAESSSETVTFEHNAERHFANAYTVKNVDSAHTTFYTSEHGGLFTTSSSAPFEQITMDKQRRALSFLAVATPSNIIGTSAPTGYGNLITRQAASTGFGYGSLSTCYGDINTTTEAPADMPLSGTTGHATITFIVYSRNANETTLQRRFNFNDQTSYFDTNDFTPPFPNTIVIDREWDAVYDGGDSPYGIQGSTSSTIGIPGADESFSSLKFRSLTSQITDEYYVEYTGTWADLGIAEDEVVTQYSGISLYYETEDFTADGTARLGTSTNGAIEITDNTGTHVLLPAQTPVGLTSWTQISNSPAISTFVAPGSPITIRIYVEMVRNSETTSFDLNVDDILFDVVTARNQKTLTATVSASSSVTGDLDSDRKLMSVSVVQSGVINANLIADRPLSSTTAAALVVDPSFFPRFRATVSGTSNVTPTLSFIVSFNPVVATTSLTPVTNGSFPMNVPSHQAGDLLVAVVQHEHTFTAGSGTYSVTGSWPRIEDSIGVATGGTGCGVSIFSKIAESSGETLSVGIIGSVTDINTHTYRFRGRDSLVGPDTVALRMKSVFQTSSTLTIGPYDRNVQWTSFTFNPAPGSAPSGFSGILTTTAGTLSMTSAGFGSKASSLSASWGNNPDDLLIGVFKGAVDDTGLGNSSDYVINFTTGPEQGFGDAAGPFWFPPASSGILTQDTGIPFNNSFGFQASHFSSGLPDPYSETESFTGTWQDLGVPRSAQITAITGAAYDRGYRFDTTGSYTIGPMTVSTSEGSFQVASSENFTSGTNLSDGVLDRRTTSVNFTGLTISSDSNVTISVPLSHTGLTGPNDCASFARPSLAIEWVKIPVGLAATVTGTSDTTIALARNRGYASQTDATTTVTGNIDETRKLLGTTAVTSVLGPTPSINVDRPFISTTNATLLVQPFLKRTFDYNVDPIVVTSTVNPNQFYYGFEAALSATSSVTATLDRQPKFTTTVAATSTVTAQEWRDISREFAATVTATSALDPTAIEREVNWNSVTSVASALLPNFNRFARLDPVDINVNANIDGNMTLAGKFQTALAATSTVGPVVLGLGVGLSSSLSVTTEVNGNIVEDLRFLSTSVAQSAVIEPTNLLVDRPLVSPILATSSLTVNAFERDVVFDAQPIIVVSAVEGTVVVITNTLELTLTETYFYEPQPYVLRLKTDTFDNTVIVNEIADPIQLSDGDVLDPVIVTSDDDGPA